MRAKKKHVLFVSRDITQFSEEAALFEESGYLVELAINNEDALKSIEKRLPNLMISELAMVDIDGLDLCRRTRQIPGARRLPIIVVGDLPKRSPIVIDAETCGANAYFQRPLRPNVLVERGKEFAEFRYSASTSVKAATASKMIRYKGKQTPTRHNDRLRKGYCWLYESGDGAVIKVYLPQTDMRSGNFSIEESFPSELSLIKADDVASSLRKLILEACQVMFVETGDADGVPTLAFAE
ncbi:MAG: response regulator [Pyrinomonadaceae bacterium]